MKCLLLLLSACWTQAAQPPPAPAPAPITAPIVRHTSSRSQCEVTVDHLAEIERDELSKVPDFADKLDDLHDLAVSSCEDSHWTVELMQCLDNTVDNTALSQCSSLFSPEQTQDLMRRVTEALTGLASPPPITP